MSKEIATAVTTILDRYAADEGKTISGEEGAAARVVAAALHAYVVQVLQADQDARVIVQQYMQHPQAASALLRMEIERLMQANANFGEQLKGQLALYEQTAVSSKNAPHIDVSGSGTVVQGSGNVVVGAGGTYINQGQGKSDQENEESPSHMANRFVPKSSLLREQIASLFKPEEIKTLCWDLHLPYEDLAGEGHQIKVIELIDYCRRNGRLSDLIGYCRRERPHVPWDYETGG